MRDFREFRRERVSACWAGGAGGRPIGKVIDGDVIRIIIDGGIWWGASIWWAWRVRGCWAGGGMEILSVAHAAGGFTAGRGFAGGYEVVAALQSASGGRGEDAFTTSKRLPGN